jgi:hypothetical protein
MWWQKFILVYFGILWVVLAVGNHGSKLVTAICYAICDECEGKTLEQLSEGYDSSYCYLQTVTAEIVVLCVDFQFGFIVAIHRLLFCLDLNLESSLYLYINILVRYLISSLVFHHLIWDHKW